MFSKLAFKSISVFLCLFLFLTNSLLVHARETHIWATRKLSIQNSKNLPALRIFSSQPKFQPKTILHIQDIHLNEEAQVNIGQKIQNLVDQKKIDLVLLEGAFDSVALSLLKDFPDKQVVKDVAEFLFSKNKITGPIYAALKSDQAWPPIVGVDDENFYRANVQAYRQSVALSDSASKEILRLQLKNQEEKEKVFNDQLLEFDRQVLAYREKNVSLESYLSDLNSFIPSMLFQDFLDAAKFEKRINFHQVEKDRARLLSHLASKLNSHENKNLLDLSVAYRLGKVKHLSFYQHLWQLCQTKQIDLNHYKSMHQYFQYVAAASRIESDLLFLEVQRIEEEIYELLSVTKKEKQLIRKSEKIFLSRKLIEFTLSPNEWEAYQASEIELDDINLKPFENFYLFAQKRDKAMAQKVLDAIKNHKAKRVVLVSGGFHAKGIRKQIDSEFQIIPYIPKVSKIDTGKGSAYLSIFNQEKTPLEKIFESPKISLVQEQWPRSVVKIGQLGQLALAYMRRIITAANVKAMAEKKLGWKNVEIRRQKDKVQFTRPYSVDVDIPNNKLKNISLQTKTKPSLRAAFWVSFPLFLAGVMPFLFHFVLASYLPTSALWKVPRYLFFLGALLIFLSFFLALGPLHHYFLSKYRFPGPGHMKYALTELYSDFDFEEIIIVPNDLRFPLAAVDEDEKLLYITEGLAASYILGDPIRKAAAKTYLIHEAAHLEGWSEKGANWAEVRKQLFSPLGFLIGLGSLPNIIFEFFGMGPHETANQRIEANWKNTRLASWKKYTTYLSQKWISLMKRQSIRLGAKLKELGPSRWFEIQEFKIRGEMKRRVKIYHRPMIDGIHSVLLGTRQKEQELHQEYSQLLSLFFLAPGYQKILEQAMDDLRSKINNSKHGQKGHAKRVPGLLKTELGSDFDSLEGVESHLTTQTLWQFVVRYYAKRFGGSHIPGYFSNGQLDSYDNLIEEVMRRVRLPFVINNTTFSFHEFLLGEVANKGLNLDQQKRIIDKLTKLLKNSKFSFSIWEEVKIEDAKEYQQQLKNEIKKELLNTRKGIFQLAKNKRSVARLEDFYEKLREAKIPLQNFPHPNQHLPVELAIFDFDVTISLGYPQEIETLALVTLALDKNKIKRNEERQNRLIVPLERFHRAQALAISKVLHEAQVGDMGNLRSELTFEIQSGFLNIPAFRENTIEQKIEMVFRHAKSKGAMFAEDNPRLMYELKNRVWQALEVVGDQPNTPILGQRVAHEIKNVEMDLMGVNRDVSTRQKVKSVVDKNSAIVKEERNDDRDKKWVESMVFDHMHGPEGEVGKKGTKPPFTPGVIKLLEGFKKRGIKLAVMSNGNYERVRDRIERFKLKRFFEDEEGNLNVWARGKEGLDPENYNKETYAELVLKHFNVKPERAVHFDDMPGGIEEASSHGVRGVGLVFSYFAWLAHLREPTTYGPHMILIDGYKNQDEEEDGPSIMANAIFKNLGLPIDAVLHNFPKSASIFYAKTGDMKKGLAGLALEIPSLRLISLLFFFIHPVYGAIVVGVLFGVFSMVHIYYEEQRKKQYIKGPAWYANFIWHMFVFSLYLVPPNWFSSFTLYLITAPLFHLVSDIFLISMEKKVAASYVKGDVNGVLSGTALNMHSSSYDRIQLNNPPSQLDAARLANEINLLIKQRSEQPSYPLNSLEKQRKSYLHLRRQL